MKSVVSCGCEWVRRSKQLIERHKALVVLATSLSLGVSHTLVLYNKSWNPFEPMSMKHGQSKVETNGPLASGITKKDCEEKQLLFSQKRGR